MTPPTNLDRFLDALPLESPADEMLRWIAGVATHVASVLGVPTPSAFVDCPANIPSEIAGALEHLDEVDCTPDLLGLAWEQLLATADRRSQGAHFTPRLVAERVVGLALDDLAEVGGTPGPAWDPTAGGGAFLLAAARAIEHRFGTDRGQIVSAMFATDIDSTALRVCDAALEMWAGGVARPTTRVANSLLDLPDDWPDNFSLIVGNPPFLGQLTSDTARTPAEQVNLKERFGDLATGYVDHSSLFVELSLRHLGNHSVLGLILPQSFLGAASSEGVRESLARSGLFRTLWVDDANSFAASVEVIAVIAVSGVHNGQAQQPHTRVVVGAAQGQDFPTPDAVSWGSLLARSQGVPAVSIRPSATRLGDIASVTAGFRQHFYGIRNAVGEQASTGDPLSNRAAPLITSGSIDPFAPQWGAKAIKFAGNRWERPWLYLDRIEDPEVQKWFEARLVPKILVASQTPVIEAVVDADATMVPSVPVITIEPHDPQMVWHVAAAISAPTTCALMIEHAAGTGLSANAIRVRARSLSEIRLPKPGKDWDEGAAAGAAAQAAWLANDTQAHSEALRILGEAMTAAYGGSDQLTTWWTSRLPGRRK